MKQLITSLAAAAALVCPLPVLAQPQVPPYSLAAMGCMKLGECTEGVKRVTSVEDVFDHFGPDWLDVMGLDDQTFFKQELYALFDRLEKIGIEVYIASGPNFPRTHRGSYYTDDNKFYLNHDWVKIPDIFMTVMRHEGWHAAQDCMAGTIDNTFIAVIHDPATVPQRFQLSAEIRYASQPKAIPWEAEAIWAGHTWGMTADALNSCASGRMWEEYDPTPKTREWLTNQGYIK